MEAAAASQEQAELNDGATASPGSGSEAVALGGSVEGECEALSDGGDDDGHHVHADPHAQTPPPTAAEDAWGSPGTGLSSPANSLAPEEAAALIERMIALLDYRSGAYIERLHAENVHNREALDAEREARARADEAELSLRTELAEEKERAETAEQRVRDDLDLRQAEEAERRKELESAVHSAESRPSGAEVREKADVAHLRAQAKIAETAREQAERRTEKALSELAEAKQSSSERLAEADALATERLRELQQAERGRADVEAEVDAAREESETSLAALTSEHGTAMSEVQQQLRAVEESHDALLADAQEHTAGLALVQEEAQSHVTRSEAKANALHCLNQLMVRADAAEVFRTFDSDGNGTLSRDELQQGFAHMGLKALNEMEMDVVMSIVDQNGDGSADYREIAKVGEIQEELQRREAAMASELEQQLASAKEEKERAVRAVTDRMSEELGAVRTSHSEALGTLQQRHDDAHAARTEVQSEFVELQKLHDQEIERAEMLSGAHAERVSALEAAHSAAIDASGAELHEARGQHSALERELEVASAKATAQEQLLQRYESATSSDSPEKAGKHLSGLSAELSQLHDRAAEDARMAAKRESEQETALARQAELVRSLEEKNEKLEKELL